MVKMMTDKCTVEKCERGSFCKGYCRKHYQRFRKYSDPLYMKRGEAYQNCEIEGCDEKVESKNLCEKHRSRIRRHGDPMKRVRGIAKGVSCSVDGCNNEIHGKGLCSAHWQRLKGYGRLERIMNAKGEGSTNKRGYRQVTVDGENRLEHRVVAEKVLGRELPKEAVVHHINGNPTDNRPENLVICPNQAYHMMIHSLQNKKGLTPYFEGKSMRSGKDDKDDE